MKKGRHRRFEEARALKRSHEVDFDGLFEDISDTPEGEHKPEHDAWADLAEEWNSSNDTDTDEDSDDDVVDDEPGDGGGQEDDLAGDHESEDDAAAS